MSEEKKVKKIKKEKVIEHPVEKILDIAPGTTIVEYEERLPTELVAHEQYDNKDNEIEEQFQEVYDRAIDAFEEQSQEGELVEGKYKARNAEVASQFLTTALNAAKEKSTLKQHKDKVKLKKDNNGVKTVNNNIIIDRNDLLKELLRSNEPISLEPKDITPSEESNTP